jgi:hypothetical protein
VSTGEKPFGWERLTRVIAVPRGSGTERGKLAGSGRALPRRPQTTGRDALFGAAEGVGSASECRAKAKPAPTPAATSNATMPVRQRTADAGRDTTVFYMLWTRRRRSAAASRLARPPPKVAT